MGPWSTYDEEEREQGKTLSFVKYRNNNIQIRCNLCHITSASCFRPIYWVGHFSKNNLSRRCYFCVAFWFFQNSFYWISNSNYLCSVQRSNRDFLHPVRFLLSYKLTDFEKPTMRPGDPLPDLNLYPIINDSLSHIHYSVSISSYCIFNDEVYVPWVSSLRRKFCCQTLHTINIDRVSKKNWTPTIFWHNFITTSRWCIIFGREDHEAIAY